MSDKLRSVNTRFWDDGFISELTPSEKLLFLYLLTNPLTNLLGIYEITLKRISFDTGLKTDTIQKGLEGFRRVKKVFFVDGFIILPNFLKNQRLNPNMKIGITKIFNQLPNELKDSILSNHSKGLPNDYQTILNSMLKYEIEIEAEIENENEHGRKSDVKLFYKLEKENAEGKYRDKYFQFVNYLYGENEMNDEITPALNLKKQVSYKQFDTLLNKVGDANNKIGSQKISILNMLKSMYNKPKFIKGNQSLYATLDSWINRDIRSLIK